MPDRMNFSKDKYFLEDKSSLDRWAHGIGLTDGENARIVFKALQEDGIDYDLLSCFIDGLEQLLPKYSEADRLLVTLGRYLQAVESPLSTVALFDREPESLKALLIIFATSPFLSEIVIAEPDVWERVRRGGGRPEKPQVSSRCFEVCSR